MAETKTRVVEVSVAILLAASGVFAAIGVFEAQEHRNAVGWFTACGSSLIAAFLIPVTIFIFFPWIEKLSMRQQPAISKMPEPHHQAVEPAKSTEDRIFVNVTPEYLVGSYKNRTDVEAEASLQRYLSKWLKLTGPLRNVRGQRTSARPHFIVYLENYSTISFSVLMYFSDPKWFPHLEVLRRGDSITIIGRIIRIDSGSVILEDCELVEGMSISGGTTPAPGSNAHGSGPGSEQPSE